MAKAKVEARPFLSGFCNPSNPLSSHLRCRGSDGSRPCSCTLRGCPCGPPIVHRCPPDGIGGIMPCCSRTPFEVSPHDRITEDPAGVTCGGVS